MSNDGFSTAETSQPWVVYTYGQTHDGWWPFWNSTRFTGMAKIGMQCAVCGESKVARMRMPRFGKVPEPAGGKHPIRAAFLLEHLHQDRPHPMSWALPLLNPAAHQEGLNLDLLAMRLQADISEEKRWLGGTPTQHRMKGHDIRRTRPKGHIRRFSYCVDCHWAFRDSRKQRRKSA